MATEAPTSSEMLGSSSETHSSPVRRDEQALRTNCANCGAFDGVFCRRRAPVLQPASSFNRYIWPQTTSEEWCLEFMRKNVEGRA